MPEVTRFYGILIKIFFTNEHNPPHFQAVYGEYTGIFGIESLSMLEGDIPIRAQKLIREWSSMYQKELMEMWQTKTLKKLPPLK